MVLCADLKGRAIAVSCGMSHEPRLRDYLTRDEVASLLRAAKNSPRHGARNYAMILLAYRHGLRASEVTGAYA